MAPEVFEYAGSVNVAVSYALISLILVGILTALFPEFAFLLIKPRSHQSAL